ncbi:cap-specific mRNA (nucleoside-2'-O-)-methyltransferase 2 [Erpetoichthys calabaricus]|uniref:Cap-specific mRNA (nucleoside-2'-O-)-methyltransferase 2 n=1 Tax=Erpetoichthys calabaricus TaxID=27687 RepID=A0A8C4S270_ERPCA|nr:cap-specific mRNA (nucleoside-2'-O-)-methyltransferase 2 [Erpetoichthys calabaricus]
MGKAVRKKMNKGKGGWRKCDVDQPTNLDFSPDILYEVKELFNKTFTYLKPSDGEWQIPNPNEALKYKPSLYDGLQSLKVSLNEIKDLLSDKDLEVWHQHTTFTNRAGKVISHVKNTVNAEICTQAWCKFYEILGNFPLLPKTALQNGELNSVHLCEAPGAFIASLNHYLKSNSIFCDWTWVANTLNPYHEANDNDMMIMDDRLIASTLPWWFFGSEDTGDIMILKHLVELQNFTKNMVSIHLVTADGSFDCQLNPDEQEALVAPLHYCEAIAALMLLSHGGSFVLKMFTLYEHSSICLLYLLNCCFEKVHVFKPATSKSGNSEVYIVCLKYNGKELVRPLLSKMIRNFGNEVVTHALFPCHLIPESFLQQHQECCTFFHKLQIATINENLCLFNCMSEGEMHRLQLLRNCTSDFFVQKFKIQHLHRSKWLAKQTLPGCNLAGRLSNQRKQVGSYNSRKKMETLSWLEKIENCCHNTWINEHSSCVFAQSFLRGATEDFDLKSWYTLSGPKLPKVRSSPFCAADLLSILNEAIEHSSCFKHHNPLTTLAVPECSSCVVMTADSLASEVLSLMESQKAYAPQEKLPHCFVAGCSSFLQTIKHFDARFVELSTMQSCPLSDCTTLHDGEPRYQKELLSCILNILNTLQNGDCFILPILSVFTRFTAGLILTLQMCFHYITFRCPASSDALGCIAVLFCIGFRIPTNELQQHLQRLLDLVMNNLGAEPSQQVLQFVPMEILLKGSLAEFLWTMNSCIMKHRLHLLVHAERFAAVHCNV